MIFKENEKEMEIETLTIKPDQSIVYFLIKNQEVIYVGQSKNGYNRPFQHNKEQDCIKIIKCNVNNIDFLENYYIEKYNPKYNKQKHNFNFYLKMCRARKLLKERFPEHIDEISKLNINKIMNKNNMDFEYINGNKFIKRTDIDIISDIIRKEGV